MAKRFIVQRWLPEGRYSTNYVTALDFSIVGDSLVFTDRVRHTAFRDWISVKEDNR